MTCQRSDIMLPTRYRSSLRMQSALQAISNQQHNGGIAGSSEAWKLLGISGGVAGAEHPVQ